MIEKDRAERLRLEALALRHVFTLPTDERGDAAAKLNAAALELDRITDACARAMRDGARLELADLDAMRTQRPALRLEDEALLEAQAGDALDAAKGFDPDTLADAYARALADTARAGELRRVEDAERLLAAARAAKTAGERRALLDDAARQLERAGRAADKPLADLWEAYRADRYTRRDAGKLDVLRLDAGRGSWAAWFNAWLGRRAGLEPGRCVIIGARPNGGKTALASVLAVDALAVGCPVLFWQLELSREEMLEHLLAQVPGPGAWWNVRECDRCNVALPEGWRELLTVPRIDTVEAYEAETIMDAMRALRRRSDRAGIAHKCRGLVLVDYAQLLTVRDRRAATPQHEILTKAASELTKTAADLGLCLVLLSQLTKEAKKDQAKGKQALEETALTGADLSRCAHVAFALSHAVRVKDEWQECGARDVETGPGGEARLLANIKRRGVAKLTRAWPEYTCPLWMSGERAFHAGDAPAGDADNWLGDDER